MNRNDMSTSFLAAVPMLHVDDMEAATRFYCGQMGLEETFRFQPATDTMNPCYMGVRMGNIVLHLSSFSGDGKAGGIAVLFLEDVQAYCQVLEGRGVDLGEGIVRQSWGNLECYIQDPFGNQLRLTQIIDHAR